MKFNLEKFMLVVQRLQRYHSDYTFSSNVFNRQTYLYKDIPVWMMTPTTIQINSDTETRFKTRFQTIFGHVSPKFQLNLSLNLDYDFPNVQSWDNQDSLWHK